MHFERWVSQLLAPFTAAPLGNGGARKLIGYVRTNWSCDPFSHGSYSHFPKGTDRALVASIAGPVRNRVFFAGEAMHPLYNSTVHAALESGQITAEALIKSGSDTVAIIGAGVSGLAAAQRLSDAGKQVTVYEARARIGGRIWTNRELGMPLDLGASWIHGVTDNPLTAMADMLAIDRVQNDQKVAVRGGDGRRIPALLAPRWLTTIADVQNSLAADPETLSLDLYEDDDGYAGPEVIFPTGYDNILAGLQGGYTLHLSQPIAAVTYGDDGVILRTAHGDDASHDAVVITVPLGVLQRGALAFNPPLPTQKQHALMQMGVGTLDKLYLLFDKVFWDDVSFITTPENDLPRGQFNDWMTFHRTLGAPVIQAFNGGPAALALASDSDEVLLAKALKTLEMAYPQTEKA